MRYTREHTAPRCMPQVGEALLESAGFDAFDAARIASCCESLGLLRHALRLHTAPGPLARVLCRRE